MAKTGITRSGERPHERRALGPAIGSVRAMNIDDGPLRVEHSPDGVALRGEVDAHTAELVRDALAPTSGSGDVCVDVSGVTFIDSSGLRIVLEAHQALAEGGRRLILVDPSRPVVRLVQVAGLTAHLHLDPPLGPADDLSSPSAPLGGLAE